MTPELFVDHALGPALKLLPPAMDTPEARAMVVAICLQESKLQHRHQVGGPAHGYAQFEAGGGVRGVLAHAASKSHARAVLTALDYASDADVQACYAAIEHNDILAAAFARLLLWTLPDKLPNQDSPDIGWKQYLKAWRPGKPHPESWDEYFNQAWDIIQ